MTPKPAYEELEGKIRILEQEVLKKTDAEKAIQESDEKFRTLYEKISIAISVVQDGFIKTLNPKLKELLGGSKEELTVSYQIFSPLDHILQDTMSFCP